MGSKIDNLSFKEKEVLLFLTKGLGYKEIATNLNLKDKTVLNYIGCICKKLEVNNVTQAVIYALNYKYGLELKDDSKMGELEKEVLIALRGGVKKTADELFYKRTNNVDEIVDIIDKYVRNQVNYAINTHIDKAVAEELKRGLS
jgi:DNA-binding CsgD family transcriptional regulator